jgi:uncharacterized protein YutD
MENKSDKLRDACIAARDAFTKLKSPEFSEIISKLDFVIGSYNYDRNPVGLIEFARIALDMLKEVKKKNPRKFSKEVLSNLEENLM